ncbi:MAG: alpha/beta hydrolase [Nannocystaceae bacterium]
MRRKVSLRSGGQVACLQWGEAGPTILLHHATGLCKEVWGEVAEPLAPYCRLISFDVRGHGDTTLAMEEPSWQHFGVDLAEVAEALANGLGLRFDLVVGHSLGGIAALIAAEVCPERFDHLLLVEPVLMDADMARANRVQRRRNVLSTRTRKQWFASREHARSELRQHALYARWSARSLHDFTSGGLRACETGGVELKCAPVTEAAIYQLGATDMLDRVGLLSGPTVEILASEVSAFSDAYQQVARTRAGMRLSTVSAGHMVPMEAPAVVVRAIARLCGLDGWRVGL